MSERIERRRRLRLPVKLIVRISGPMGRGHGVMTDLSMRGCNVETYLGLREGVNIGLQLLVPEEEGGIAADAVVRGCRGPHMGVEFLDLTPAEKQRLGRFVFRLWKNSEDLRMQQAPMTCVQTSAHPNP